MVTLQLLCMALAIVLVWALISHASAGDVLAGERSARITAEAKVAQQATQIAVLQPTPRACGYNYQGRC